MHTGKISEIAYKRSVLKKITSLNDQVQVGVDASCTELEDVTAVISSNCILEWFEGCESYYLQKSLNDIYTKGGIPGSVQIYINIPKDFEEKKLGRIIRNFNAAVEEKHLEIVSCKTYASNINKPIAHINVLGNTKYHFSTQDITENYDVVMAGTLAIGTTTIMSEKYKKKLQEKLHGKFISDCMELKKHIDIKEMTDIALNHQPVYMHNISDGGVFGAIWEVASAVDKGVTADVKKIPVWQESIEVAEIIGYNPYVTDGTGAVLIVIPDGSDLVEDLHDKGFFAEIIGKITSGKDRVVTNGDEKRFLEPPKGDEIYDWL